MSNGKQKEIKSLKVSKELHKELKAFCAQHETPISEFVEKTLRSRINKARIKTA